MRTDHKAIMKKNKSSDEQVVGILPAADSGGAAASAINKQQNKEKSDLDNRKNKPRMTAGQNRQLRLLEDENQKLKQLVAELTLKKVLLQEALARRLSGQKEKIIRPKRHRTGPLDSIER
jgi:putative transposase